MKHAAKATAAVIAALVAALSAGCGDGGDGGEPSPSPDRTTEGTASPRGAAAVEVRSGPLGRILTDGRGRTLYLFEADTGGKSNCTGACAAAWPPLLTTGRPDAGDGADADLLGTTTRDGGATQVTYDEHPLYHFVGDREPGDTAGQGLDQFGATWFVLGPDGDRITEPNDGGDQDGGY
ncbi:hypothetical protein [Streptomyces sp. NPDC018031]|uniref:hypothetical protein n=1 Tax=Streptomyces sp. NPDC018031 TaxID=3365033 RepID=UPI00378A1CB7